MSPSRRACCRPALSSVKSSTRRAVPAAGSIRSSKAFPDLPARESAAQRQYLADTASTFELVNRGLFERAQHGHTRAYGWNDDDVAGLQRHVAATVAARDEIIEIQVTDDTAIAFQLDIAHRTRVAGPPTSNRALIRVERLETV